MPTKTFAPLLLIYVCLASDGSAAENLAGSLKTLEGKVYVVRGPDSFEGREGMRILIKDVLVTTAQGRVGIILHDGTRVSLGPNSELRVEQFLFEPSAGQFGLLLKLMKGAAAYVSGKIEKFSPGSARIETPVGMVGLRGTELAISLDSQ